MTDGECIKRITETFYTNYGYVCDEGLLPRNSNPKNLSSERLSKEMFSIYPNPLNDQMLVLNMPVQVIGENVEISLKTIQGKVIHKWKNMKAYKKMSVNAGNYLFENSGMYLISIKSKSKVFTKKFYYLK